MNVNVQSQPQLLQSQLLLQFLLETSERKAWLTPQCLHHMAIVDKETWNMVYCILPKRGFTVPGMRKWYQQYSTEFGIVMFNDVFGAQIRKSQDFSLCMSDVAYEDLIRGQRESIKKRLRTEVINIEEEAEEALRLYPSWWSEKKRRLEDPTMDVYKCSRCSQVVNGPGLCASCTILQS
jgi:hypothetical protein